MYIFSNDSFDITSKKINALINWNASNEKSGWIKFGVGYCFPSVLRIDQHLFSAAVYENLIFDREKRMIFFSLFKCLKKLIITVQNYYWDFLPFELIFANPGNGCGLDLEFCSDRYDDNSKVSKPEKYLQSVQSLTQFIQQNKKYAQTMNNKEKIRKIRSLTVTTNDIGDHDFLSSSYSLPQVCFQSWQMLYRSLIGDTIKMRILNGYVGTYKRLILSLTDYRYTYSNRESNNNIMIDISTI